MTRTLVGLSGGVDSSTVVSLLRASGQEPVAVTLVMQHGSVPVPSPGALARACETAEQLGVEHCVRDVSDLFSRCVVERFFDSYASGRTPNPCVVCNDEVKFASLAAVAEDLGCPRIATGHYARLVRGADGIVRVARGADAAKDQSYFLYRVRPSLLERVDFPLGDLEKTETRVLACEQRLPAATAKDSTGICFAPGGDYRKLLEERRPGLLCEGDIVDESGTVLGRHGGVARYTVGQRKGLGLSGGPWFIVRLEASSNTVVVARGAAPLRRSFVVRDAVFWGEIPAGPFEIDVQTRYHALSQRARVARVDGGFSVSLLAGETYAAEGQSCVFYQDDVVLGGGFIAWS